MFIAEISLLWWTSAVALINTMWITCLHGICHHSVQNNLLPLSLPLAVELLSYIAVIPVSFELLFNKELISNGSVLLAHEFTS